MAPSPRPSGSAPSATSVRRTAIACAGLAFGMVGLAFASVPLYDLFCRVTGFGGTPRVAQAVDGRVTDRMIRVRFDANVAPGLGWRFEPETDQIDLRVGEPATVTYKLRNTGSWETVGVATYNVSPPQIGAYFVKIQCFCFTDTRLKPGEAQEATVAFYIDPELTKEADLAGLRDITLSYTFFPSKSGRPVAAAEAGARPGL